MKKTLFIYASIALMSVGCASISEESCIAGSWESLGYEDGRNGESRGHFNKIAETCAKYGITANAPQYRAGYDVGLPLYCSYDKGFNHGETGRSIKTECREINSLSYIDGYDDGLVIYEIRREYDALVEVYFDHKVALEDITLRLSDISLEDGERKRLRKKRRRLENRLDEARIDVRAFERVQGWPKKKLPRPEYGDTP